MNIDVNALKAQAVLKGKKLSELTIALGISKSALYRKLNGTSEFTRKEIATLIEYLEIPDPMEIFFSPKVS